MAMKNKKKRRTIPETRKARLILDHATQSAEAFLKFYDESRKKRRKSGGMTTDEEQDLLRGMLVFSAAGLDSLLKQLFRDALRKLAASDPRVQEELEKFVSRQIRGDKENPESIAGTRFLARALLAQDPQARLIEDYVQELTGSSLQSSDQVIKATRALGLTSDEVKIDAQELQRIFEVRHQIVHELDVKLDARTRNRNIRKRDEMEFWSRVLLELGKDIISAVERKLSEAN